MEGFERRWLLEGSWRLLVEERDDGWSIREADAGSVIGDRPLRWSDSTSAFGVASDEFRLEGRSGTWCLRVYHGKRVVAAAPVPGRMLEIPHGWWMDPGGEEATRSLGLGAAGTSVEDLERCERRGWEAGLAALRAPADPGARFSIVRDWHRHDEGHGDTALLHRMAPIGGEASLRGRLLSTCGQTGQTALDCQTLVVDTDTEDALADGLLFAHQCFGARWLSWNAPPSAVVVRALERAHMDAQGELFGVWLAGHGPIPSRSAWRRLGPVLRASDSDRDCYVWQR